ncbi:MAG TPA: alkaline phosphatase, partial [Bacillota bacterium]|nr:alkaline phosphatase [Bacillota bacterium]
MQETASPFFIEDNGSMPTMRELTRKALELLSQAEEGFFVMIEGSHIDWACHENDPASTLYEIAAFDEAVAEALEFLAENPDTLIVVCADHETGGLILVENS